jgi:hypothetical protein
LPLFCIASLDFACLLSLESRNKMSDMIRYRREGRVVTAKKVKQ